MHCPVCQTENGATASTCTRCGNPLSDQAPQKRAAREKRRASRQTGGLEVTDSPFSNKGEGNNRAGLAAYRLSVYGIIPGVGMVLGPVAMVRAWQILRRSRNDPEFIVGNTVRAAIGLGLAEALTQWGGAALMIWGWTHP